MLPQTKPQSSTLSHGSDNSLPALLIVPTHKLLFTGFTSIHHPNPSTTHHNIPQMVPKSMSLFFSTDSLITRTHEYLNHPDHLIHQRHILLDFVPNNRGNRHSYSTLVHA